MNYQKSRPLIRSGDLIGQSGGSWKTWAGIKVNMVRIFTRSTYSHVGIAWVVGGRVFMLEAVKPRLRIYPMSKIGDFYWLPMEARWGANAEHAALENVGVEYSELVALKAFFGPLEEGNVQQCAAYALTVFRADAIDLGNRATPDSVVLAAMRRGSECVFVTQDS